MTISTQHPDYTRILEGIAGFEAQVTDDDLALAYGGADSRAAVDRLVSQFDDPDSVRAVAVDRTYDMVESFPEMILLTPHTALRSIWMDGFTAGVQFQQAGGHVEFDSDS